MTEKEINEIDELLGLKNLSEPSTKKILIKISFYASKFFFVLTFSIWGYLIGLFSDVLFSNEETKYEFFVWIYFGILILVIFKILKKWNSKANLIKLGGHFLGFMVLLSLVLWIFNIDIKINNGKIILLDDITYHENDDYDGSPYSGSAGGYSWQNKYFIDVDLLKDGEFFNDTIQILQYGKEATLKTRTADEINLNIEYASFWQYAYIKGYKNIGKEHNTAGFFNIILTILPFYFLEQIIAPIMAGLLFSSLILGLTIFYNYDITEKDKN